MNHQLPAEIEVIEQPNGVVYRLPTRNVGGYRQLGYVLVFLGTLLFAAPMVPLWKIVETLCNKIPPEKGILWFGGFLFLSFLFRAGWSVFTIGMLIVEGHSEIELRDGMLHSREYCSSLRWIRWDWEHTATDLRRLFVSEGLDVHFGRLGSGSDLCVITPEWKPAVNAPNKTMSLAPGYPRSWLLPLAHDLSRRCAGDAAPLDQSTTPATPTDGSPTAIAARPLSPQYTADPSTTAISAQPHSQQTAISARALASAGPTVPGPAAVEQRAPDLSDYEELTEPPLGTEIVVQESPQGLMATVPAPGWKRNLPWFLAGLFVAFWAFGVTSTLFEDEETRGHSFALTLGIALLAWTLAIALLVVGMNYAIRHTTFAVAGDTLTLWRSGVLGDRRNQWRREELADIYVMEHPGDSDNGPHWELHIHPFFGEPLHLLAYQDLNELRWLATLLRRALHCPGEAPNSPPVGFVVMSPRVALRGR
jgi:hypothetical protein